MVWATALPLKRGLKRSILNLHTKGASPIGCSYIPKMDFELMPARTACHSITLRQQKISDIYLNIWPIAPLFCVGVRANGKRAKNWSKNDNIQKWACNHPKSRKRLESKPILSFLGDVGLIKVVSEFSSGHPKCHFWALKDGHFCQKCPILGPFPLARTPTQNSGAIGQILRYMSEIFRGFLWWWDTLS